MVYRCQDGYEVNPRNPYRFQPDLALEHREPKFNFAKRQNDARAISVTFLENMEGGKGLVDQGQVDVVRFYLSRL